MKLAQPDLDEMLVSKRKEDLANAEELRGLFANLDANHDGTVNFDEFHAKLQDPHMVHYFEMKGLAVTDAEMCFKMLQEAAQKTVVDMDTFIGMFMKRKGFAMNIDVMSLQFQLTAVSEAQHHSMRRITEEVRQVRTVFNTVSDSLQDFERQQQAMRTDLESAFIRSV